MQPGDDEAARTDDGPVGARDRRRVVELVGQQLWLIGADIRCSEENRLVGLGFQRYRAPDPHAGSSCYVAPAADRLHVHLWGFGCAWRSQEAGYVFLARCDPTPRWILDPAGIERVHTIDEVICRCRTGSDPSWWREVGVLLGWFARYERTVQGLPGSVERARALAARRRRPACEMSALPDQLDQLAARLRSIGGEMRAAGGSSGWADGWSDDGGV